MCREVFRESSPGVANHVMGVVHGAVSYLPELVQYLATMHPDLQVKAGEPGHWSPDSHMTSLSLSLCLSLSLSQATSASLRWSVSVWWSMQRVWPQHTARAHSALDLCSRCH